MATKRKKLRPRQMNMVGPNQKPILPVRAQLPILRHVHELTQGGPEKMISWSKHYYWKPPTVAYKVYSRPSICPKYNPGKPLHRSQGHFPLPSGPFEVW